MILNRLAVDRQLVKENLRNDFELIRGIPTLLY